MYEGVQQPGEDDVKGVKGVIWDSLYNLRRMAALSYLEHGFLSLHYITQFVELISVVLHVGAQSTCLAMYCSSKCDMNY